MNWTSEEVAARERIIKQQTARDLAGALSALTMPEPAQSSPPSLRTHNLSVATRATGRIRQPKGMNKTEFRYAAHLELQKTAGAVAWYAFEKMTLKLADDLRYTPDFAVMAANGALEFHEVKGRRSNGKPYYEDDARKSIAMAAQQFPARFVMVWPGKSGEWESREF